MIITHNENLMGGQLQEIGHNLAKGRGELQELQHSLRRWAGGGTKDGKRPVLSCRGQYHIEPASPLPGTGHFPSP